GDEAVERAYAIAEPPALTELTCGQTTDCEVKGTHVSAPASSSVVLKFNNQLGLGWNDGAKLVDVMPKPKNLYVSGWSDLAISASFMPSTTYTMRIAGLRDQYGATVAPLT